MRKKRREDHAKSLERRKVENERRQEILRQQYDSEECMNSQYSLQDMTYTGTHTIKKTNDNTDTNLQTNFDIKKVEKNPIFPGPGHYNIMQDLSPEKIHNSNNAISFDYHGFIHNKLKLIPNPGPGAYSPCSLNRVKSCAFKGIGDDSLAIDLLKRRRQLIQKDLSQPALIGQISCLKSTSGVKISPPEKQKDDTKNQVSPVSYTIMDDKPTQCFTMAGKNYYSPELGEKPGPGAYSIEKSDRYRFSSVGRSIGRIHKNPICQKESPGPTTYNPMMTYKIPTYKYF